MNIRTLYIFVFLTLLTVLPLSAFAQQGTDLIFCNTGTPRADGTFANPCTFNSVIELIQKIITFLVKVAVVLTSLSFVIAGFLLISDGGNEKNVQRAKKIMTNTVIGFAFILGAWVIVYTIVNVLVDPNKATNLLQNSAAN